MTARRIRRIVGSLVEELESRTLFTIQELPIRPTNLTATALTSTSIQLKWTDNVPNELTFRIYRAVDDLLAVPDVPSSPSTVWTEVVRAPAGSIKWIDGNLTPGTTYFYQIRSVTSLGVSEPSPFTLIEDPEHPADEAEAAVFATTLATDAFAQVDTNTNDLVVRGTSGDDVISVTKSGGDIVVVLNALAPLNFPIASAPRIQVYGLNGNDTITIGSLASSTPDEPTVKLVNIVGGNGNDTITGSDKNDRIDGGNGRDSIDGGLGNDSLFGGGGNDRIFGGADDDFMDGGVGNDRLEGGDGNDSLIGGTGHDQLLGQGGLDSLFGDAKFDVLDDI